MKFIKDAAKDKVLKAFQRAKKDGQFVEDSKEWVQNLKHKLKNKQPVVPEHFKYNYPKNK